MNIHDHYQDWPAWKNGQFCKVKDVSISVLDDGLLRSYGVYEVIAVKDGWSLAIDQHLKRFADGCRYWFFKHPYDQNHLLKVIAAVSGSVSTDCTIWIVATRGVAVSYEIRDVITAQPQISVIAAPYRQVGSGRALRLGIARRVRRIPDTCIDQSYKNFARQDFTLAQIETSMKGLDNAVLLDHDNFLTEGPAFSLALVKDGTVLSPARNRLAGVTMNVVKSLCEQNNIGFEYTNIDEALMQSAQDMFATSTAGGIIPVASVDTKQFLISSTQKKIQDLYCKAWTDPALSRHLV